MAQEMGLLPGGELHIETDAGARVCRVNALRTKGEYTVEVTAGMGMPTFALKTVTLLDGLAVDGVEVSTGNPHFVIVVDNAAFAVADRPWRQVGAEICLHSDFPQQTNVEFARVVSEHEIEIRIFERGVGPTASSGTGTSAAATSVIALGLAASPLHVAAPGGAQAVEWEGPGTELTLTGPASLIARGEAWPA
jgi:diaminopimelate epimerase